MIERHGLPHHLAERVRPVNARTHSASREFVLYWLNVAARAHENPALDVALLASAELDLPLLVYHALSERYPFASDRHHTFILEGAQDVQRQFAARNIAYVFHLERDGHRGAHLLHLARRAALVVTEDMPVDPLRAWLARLGSATTCPVWAVDTACVVPMRLPGRSYDRAFAYRRATEGWRRERVAQPWPEQPDPPHAVLPDLPFAPLDLTRENLPTLVAQCEIDHGVAPVPHTRGGSTAGYSRWEAFKKEKLDHYARDRNDPLRRGVSRMSAYLHYGHVSPLRLAREAAARGGPGAEKFLDELLVWRELAYTYCAFREDHDTVTALPDWARRTLREHERDPRPALHSPETLARARTGDALWDAAQASLRIHGELHNNVRMTWGKSLLQWTPDASSALDLLVDLNHRFALDGRDPASFGGILWCLGQFDRPFRPESPILGQVRSRSTKDHARRLDVARFGALATRPLLRSEPRVAVVGAGISGLVCARVLADHGLAVTVFDEHEAPGGRVSTSRSGERAFDDGAQYFTARDPRFTRHVKSWIQDGLVSVWNGRIVAIDRAGHVRPTKEIVRHVGVPDMTVIARHLSADCELRLATPVRALVRDATRWLLRLPEREAGPFDAVIVAVPAPQAARLLAPVPELVRQAAAVRMAGCWSVAVGFEAPLDVPFDGAFVDDDVLSWIAGDGRKPGRTGETWVLHANAEWSDANAGLDATDAARRLVAAFERTIDARPAAPRVVATRHWPHALPRNPLPRRCLFDAGSLAAACGDWCGGPRVEGAFLSGTAAAGSVLGVLSARAVRGQGRLFPVDAS